MIVFLLLTGCGRRDAELVLTKEKDQTETQDELQFTQAPAVSETTGEITPSPMPMTIYVDVCGAVASPGVYKLPSDSRVFEAIEAAGGLLPEASGSSINQAQPVTDGQQIYVPTAEEVQAGFTTASSNHGTVSEETAGTESSSDAKINLNTATLENLMTLPGIGESKAQAILSYREENGSFSSIEEIMQVPGIKEGTFSKIKDKLAIE